MTKKYQDDPTAARAALRQSADRQIQKQPVDMEALSPKDILETLHELQLHQLELEMQNDELRRTQEELDTMRARYFDLYDMAPVGYVTLSEQGLIIDANQAAANLLSVPRVELVKRFLHDFIFKDHQDIYYQLIKKLLETGEPQACELQIMKKNDTQSVAWVALTATAAQDVEGALTFRVVLSDAPERQRSDEALRESENRYRTLVEFSPDGIGIHCEGKLVFVNSAAVKLFQANSPEDLIGLPVIQFVHPDYHAIVMKRMHQGYENQESASPMEEKLITLSGKLLEVEVTATPIVYAGKAATQLIIRDINTRKQTEDALRESEGRYHSLFDRMLDGVYRSTHAGKFVDVNPVMVKMFGYSSKEEMLEIDIKAELYFAPEERGTHKLDTGLGEIDVYRLRRKDGSEIWVEDRGTYVYDAQGNVTFHEGIMRDVTQRVQAEEALAASESKLRAMVEQVPAIVYTESAETRETLYISPQIERLTGYTPAEWVKERDFWEKMIHPTDLAAVLAEDARTTATYEPFDMEYRISTRDGRKLWIRDEAMMIQNQDGTPLFWQGVMYDVTEHKQSETERQTLLEIMQGLVLTKDLPDFLSLVHHSISNVIFAENFFVVLYNKNTEMFEEVYSVDKFDQPGSPSRLEKSACAYVFHTGQPQLISQARFNELAALGEVELVGTNSPSWLGVPLKTSSQTIGVMVVQDYEKPDSYSEHDVDFLASIAGQVALAVERKQADESLRESEAILTKVQGVAHMGSWGINLATKTVLASDEALRIYGIAQGDLTMAYVQSIPLPEFRPNLDAALTALITEGKRYDVEFKIKRLSDGEIRDLHSMAEYSASSRTIIGSVQDITERKRAEESIHRRAMELETINRISLALRGVSEQKQMLEIVLDEALAILNTTHGSIELYNKATNNLEKTITRGWAAQITEQPQNISAGISGKVFTRGEIHISHEFASDPETRAEARNQLPPNWGGACLPIRTTQQTLGVLMVCVPSERELDKDEIRLLSILSELTGAALQRMQLHNETARRAEEFAALYETSNAISAENELHAVLQAIVEHAQVLLNSASSAIYLYLAQSDELVLTVNTASYLEIGTHLKNGEGVAGIVAQTRQPLRVDDYSTWDGRSAQYIENYIHAVLEVPMLYGGELIGVLTADETGESKRRFSEADERLLSLFASQAAGAIHSARLHEETVHRLENLQALRAVDQAISNSHDMHLTLNVLLTQTIAQLKVDAADVLLLRAGSNLLELVAGRGFYTLLLESTNLSASFAARAILEHRSILTIDLESALLHENPQLEKLWKKENFVCYWCVPLIVKGEVKGALEVYSRAAFTPNAEWLEFLEALAGQAAITIDSTQLFENLQRANLDLSLAYDATIEGWSRAMDLRDHETEGHTLRVTDLTLKLARAMQVNESQLTAIRRGALLHDIGKMGVPDSILHKEGNLNDAEWESMRKHPQLARDMLLPIAYLKDALDIPYCHHERWDGSGYPQGLKSDHIPLVARIFAIVDVWDALTNDRIYRKKWTKQKTRHYIIEQSSKHFDPQVVYIFLKLIDDNALDENA
ncbi:MAG: PAS domain S-box protein [Chloroflexi bacterium]|nr:PAS domain S-box protein [Chloroflexota bacterium]